MSASPPEGGGRPPRRDDPWEARERMLAKYRRDSGSANRSSNTSRSSAASSRHEDFGPAASDEIGLENNINVAGLLAGVALLLLAEVPTLNGTLRKVMAQLGTAVLLLLISLTRRWRPVDRPLAALLRAPNLPLIALLAWTAFEYIRAPYRDFAAVELLRVTAGAAAYLLAAYSIRTARQAAYVVAGLLGAGVFISLWDIAKVGETGWQQRQIMDFGYSIFGTHEDIASLLVLLLPIAISISLTAAVEEKRRLAATAASIVLGAALLVARTRTSWFGGLAALIVLACLSVWTNLRRASSEQVSDLSGSRGRRGGRVNFIAALTSPTSLLAIAMLTFCVIGGVGPLLHARAPSLHAFIGDGSFSWRLESWRGAARMTAAEPFLGWGLGAYPVIQGLWTHHGAELQTVLSGTYGHENIAHDYYVQWAADNGATGLILYVATVVSALFTAIRSLKRVESPFARALLLGCTAAIAGSLIDALGSPAYNFFGVSTVLWLCIGLTVAAPGFAWGKSSPPPDPERSLASWGIGAASVIIGAAAAAIVIGLGIHMGRLGKSLPRGVFSVTLSPAGKIAPGDTIHWTSRYTDKNKQELSTMPGTQWYILPGDASTLQPRASLTGESFGVYYQNRSTLTMTALATRTPITVHARYCDRYGRWYDGWSIVQIAPPAPAVTAVPPHPPISVH